MEADRHRLNEGSVLDGDVANGDNLLPRQRNIFTHSSPALHAKGLVVFTGIIATVTTRGAHTAVSIRIDSNGHPLHEVLRNVGSRLFYHGTNLMARHHRHLHHRVQASISIEVAAAESHVLDTQQHFTCPAMGLLQVYDLHLRRCDNLYCFHLIHSCSLCKVMLSVHQSHRSGVRYRQATVAFPYR